MRPFAVTPETRCATGVQGVQVLHVAKYCDNLLL